MSEKSGQETMGEATQSTSSDGHVRKVKQTWQIFEDYGLAHRLQNEEFNQHFHQNRFERKLMHGDIKVSKEKQKQEDQFAAEYYEQLRRDREREDERIAMEIQQRIEMEEGSKMCEKRRREIEDEILARRLQEMEMANNSAKASNNSSAKPLSPSAPIFAGPSNGPYRPAPQRHASIPADPSQNHKHISGSINQTAIPLPGMSASSSSSVSASNSKKSAPPPRPPPPRHNSLR